MAENILAKLQHWIEIDLDKLASNAQILRQHLQAQTPGLKLWAVVKNDAYGYGAVECAQTLVTAGVDGLAVTSLEEALQLREAGLEAPLLVFLPPQAAELRKFCRVGRRLRVILK